MDSLACYSAARVWCMRCVMTSHSREMFALYRDLCIAQLRSVLCSFFMHVYAVALLHVQEVPKLQKPWLPGGVVSQGE